MTETKTKGKYDLEERTLAFAKAVRAYSSKLSKSTAPLEDTRQVIRSSGSVGANYIEANEALSKKDFVMRIKICRKEAKETRYWLNLLQIDENLEKTRLLLVKEAEELMNIFGAILRKSEP